MVVPEYSVISLIRVILGTRIGRNRVQGRYPGREKVVTAQNPCRDAPAQERLEGPKTIVTRCVNTSTGVKYDNQYSKQIRKRKKSQCCSEIQHKKSERTEQTVRTGEIPQLSARDNPWGDPALASDACT